MNHSFDFIIIFIRLLIDIPVLYFLWRQFQLRDRNGNIKLVRRLVTVWVIAFAVQMNYAAITRYLQIQNIDTSTQSFDAVSFFISLAMLGAAIYGIYIYEKIQIEDELKHKQGQ